MRSRYPSRRYLEEKNAKSFLQTLLITMGLMLAVLKYPEDPALSSAFSYSFFIFVLSVIFLYSGTLKIVFSINLAGSFALIFLIFIIPDGLYLTDNLVTNQLIFVVLYWLISSSMLLIFLQPFINTRKSYTIYILVFICGLVAYITGYNISGTITERIILIAIIFLFFICLLCTFSGMNKVGYIGQLSIGTFVYFFLALLGYMSIQLLTGQESNLMQNSSDIIQNSTDIIQNNTNFSVNTPYNFTNTVKEKFSFIIFSQLKKP